MNRTEHLLTILAEECAEVAKNATKALRFGLTDHEPGLHESNAERIMYEYHDLQAVIVMLQGHGLLPVVPDEIIVDRVRAKCAKVEKYLLYSAKCGTLDGRNDG